MNGDSEYGFPVIAGPNDFVIAKKLIEAAVSETEDKIQQSLTRRVPRISKLIASTPQINRLRLRPMAGHEFDPDIHERLEQTLATIIKAATGHVGVAKKGDAYSVLCVLSRGESYQRCMIAWLAHHALKNNWSLQEDIADAI
tara:strand:- start:7993 stop:8418 length:426 start_codon:yes stop_codon:yes gene_type:complete